MAGEHIFICFLVYCTAAWYIDWSHYTVSVILLAFLKLAKYLFIYLFISFWTLCLHFVISGTFQISQISLFQTVTFNEFVQNLVSELIQNLHLEYVFMWIRSKLSVSISEFKDYQIDLKPEHRTDSTLDLIHVCESVQTVYFNQFI